MMKGYSSTIVAKTLQGRPGALTGALAVTPSKALAAALTIFFSLPGEVRAEETLLLQGIVRHREVAGELDTAIYDQAIQKLSRKEKLSTAQYRSLGVGCIGLEWSYPSTGRPKVTAVYSGSPAEKAGIRLGEEIYQEVEPSQAVEKDKGRSGQDKERQKDPTPAHFTLMREGTEQEVTILRNGQPLKFILKRINIADLTDRQARLKWQKVISSIGVPQDGFYTGRDLHNLKLTQTSKPVDY